jgi:hypothetical protein
MSVNTNTLETEINRLIDSSDYYKEARKAILYSLVTVWLKFKNNDYSEFCKFVNCEFKKYEFYKFVNCEFKKYELLTFNIGVTDFINADSSVEKVKIAVNKTHGSCVAYDTATSALKAAQAAQRMLENVALDCAKKLKDNLKDNLFDASNKAFTFAAEQDGWTNQTLYYLIAAYINLINEILLK